MFTSNGMNLYDIGQKVLWARAENMRVCPRLQRHGRRTVHRGGVGGQNANEQARKCRKAPLDLVIGLQHKRSGQCGATRQCAGGWRWIWTASQSWRGGMTCRMSTVYRARRSLLRGSHESARFSVKAHLLIISDTWLPQVNGVVRSIEVLRDRRGASSRRRN